MHEPGWYHAQGDPAGSVRYWDGHAWRGEPTLTPTSSGGIEYFDAGPTQINLGDIATQRTLAEQAAEGDLDTESSYALSPYSVSKAAPPSNIKRKPSKVLNVATITLFSVVGPVLLFLLGVRGAPFYALVGIVVIASLAGRTSAMTSIGSSMRTTK